MASGKNWGRYAPSRDGAKETEALRKLYHHAYLNARALANSCLKRRVETLHARMAQVFEPLPFAELEAQYYGSFDAAVERGLLLPEDDTP